MSIKASHSTRTDSITLRRKFNRTSRHPTHLHESFAKEKHKLRGYEWLTGGGGGGGGKWTGRAATICEGGGGGGTCCNCAVVVSDPSSFISCSKRSSSLIKFAISDSQNSQTDRHSIYRTTADLSNQDTVSIRELTPTIRRWSGKWIDRWTLIAF